MIQKICILLISLIFCYVSTALAAEPENLTLARNHVIHYYTSGEYSYDVNRIATMAEQYIAKRVIKNKDKKKLAIVFDLDDTLISNFSADRAEGFCETQTCINRIMSSVRDARIPAMLRLFNFAKKNGVAVFIVTGRLPKLRKATINLLHASGYKNWTKLYLLPKGYHGADFVSFKSNIRREIISQNFDIILNMGDHYSDLKGGYADMVLKIPNPCN